MPPSCDPHPGEPYRVVVDDREWRSSTAAWLRRSHGARLTVRRLSLGDYVVEDLLTVERKTLADLAASICDGRLFRQAQRLYRSPAHRRSCLILVGIARDLRHVGVAREALHGALVTLGVVFDLPVLRARDDAEAAHLILMAAGQLRRRRSSLVKRHGPRPANLQRSQLLMLEGVPGVGPARATALLTRFGTPAGVARASLEEIRSVPGVGPAVAAQLLAVLHTGGEGPGTSRTARESGGES